MEQQVEVAGFVPPKMAGQRTASEDQIKVRFRPVRFDMQIGNPSANIRWKPLVRQVQTSGGVQRRAKNVSYQSGGDISRYEIR